MAIDEKQKAKLEEMIEKLEKVRGRHTELITVYISAGFNINVVAKQLESEKSTAKNIKSKATQKAVLE
ncbi:MAG: peptide chain release factor 1, partial [Nanoarchaeota archaeon]|nr:peptide chain release factor 1 [Nanoarchaeota archaeon]